MSRKTCSNCEGEGVVCYWGYDGHEVPASRREKYPRDWPAGNTPGEPGEPFGCEECGGTGMIAYDDRGNRIRSWSWTS